MLDNETKKRIDDCRNILVGKVPDPKSQVEQITIAMIYKFMYDMDLESIEMGGVSTYFVGEYEKYSWSNIFNPRIGGNEMIALYGEGIVKMNLNPNIPQLFRDIFKNAYLPYRDPETLKLFLKGINEFHYSHSEKLGDAFEYLLSVLGSQGDAGQFRTPRHIIDFVVELIQPKKNEKILDPACGTSGFLISSYKHIKRNNTKKNLGDLITPDERNKLVENINGYDISPDMVRLSLVNLYLHNFSNPKIYEYDSLTSEDRWNEYYDVILANPPFMSPKGGIKPHKRFSIQSNRAEVLFVDYIMEHLTPKGRSGIVVPEGIIFQSGIAYKSLRKSLVEKYLVGVISLPSGVFQPYSGVKTSILILDKELSQKTDKIFFGKVDNDGFDLGSQRREIEKNDLPIITKEVTEYLEGLRKGKVVESEKLTYVPKEEILGSTDIGLSYDRFVVTEKYTNSNYDILDINELVTYKRGTSITKKDVTEGEIPVIAGGQTPAYYHNEYNRSGETITISSSGAYSGFINYFTTPIFASDCFTISPNDSSKLYTKFLYLILKSKQEEIYKLQVGGAQPHIYPKSFIGFNIPLPPIEVQEEIVRELDQYQKIIDGAKQVVENYKPVFEIDPNWEMKTLSEISVIVRGSSPRPQGDPKYFGGKVPRLMIADITRDGMYVIPKIDNLTELGATKSRQMKKGEVVIAVSGNPGLTTILGIDSCIHDGFVGFRELSKEILPEYLYHILTSLKENTNNQAVGAVFRNLTTEQLKTFSIPIPSLEIQKSIVERIESERQLIEGNKKLIEIYTQKIQDRINKIWGE